MFNFTKNYFFLFLFLSSFSAQAALMDSSLLTDDHFITVDHGNGELLDWAWVSNISSNYTYEDNVLVNTLYAPELIDGWRVALESEFLYFLQNYSAIDFKNTATDPGNGVDAYKIAAYFWNDNEVFHDVSASDFDDGYITSSWVSGSVNDFFGTTYFDTFYVREHQTLSEPVPEPSTTLIFAIALIALTSRKRLFN